MIFLIANKAARSGVRMDSIKVTDSTAVFVFNVMESNYSKRIMYAYNGDIARPIKSMSLVEFELTFSKGQINYMKPKMRLFRKEIWSKYESNET